MRNLLRVRFFRWMHSRLVWAAAGAVLVTGLLYAFTAYREDGIDNLIFSGDMSFPLTALFITAAITAIQVGSDLQDGTVRCALISGFTKMQIFLAHLIPASCFAFVTALLHLLPLLRCPEVLSRLTRRYTALAFLGMGAAFFTVTAITVCFTLLTGSRVAAVVLCTAMTFGSMLAVNSMTELLNQPFYIRIVNPQNMKNDGGCCAPSIVRNFQYVAPPERTRMVWLTAAMPSAPYRFANEYFQTAQRISSTDEMVLFYENEYLTEMRAIPEELLEIIPAAQCTLFILFASGGILLFRRKDIN